MKTVLDPTNVETIFMDCMADNIDGPNTVVTEGIMAKMAFDRDKLAMHRTEIGDMLSQLPTEFKTKDQGGGDGWSFLNACMDSDGNQWTGMHSTMDQLFVLGIATDQAEWCMPKEMWDLLPGGMPYVVVTA